MTLSVTGGGPQGSPLGSQRVLPVGDCETYF
jgi:hypothetical protein